MNEQGSRFVFLPMETKNREFHGKLLLSCVAAEAGFRAILCEQQELRRLVHRSPPGIYVDKSVVASKAGHFRDLRRMGHRVVAWCEEGLVYRNRDMYLRQRIAPETFEYVDRFFTWGSAQAADVATKIPEAPLKTLATGNPRFDLLRKPFRTLYETEAERLHRQHGSFVLINTNFSRYNHFYSPEYQLQRWKKRGRIRTPEDEQFFWDWSGYIGKLFHSFVDMTRELSQRLPDVTIVVRPHPSENHDRWKEAVAGPANVMVCHEGPVIPWIMASRALVHNSCTTGVEAFLLGRPVVAYMPVTSSTFDDRVPNGVSLKVTSVDELATVLRCIVDTGAEPEAADLAARRALAGEYVANMDGEFACDRIVAELLRVSDLPGLESGGAGSRLRLAVSLWWRRLRRAVRRSRSHSKQKFPGLTLQEVEEAVAAFRRVSNRFAGVTAIPVPGMQNGFQLTQKGNS